MQIDELKIRIPGMNEAEGASLGQQVAERVAAAIPENSDNYRIPEINIQMKGSINNDTTLMADRIAEQIIRQIRGIGQM